MSAQLVAKIANAARCDGVLLPDFQRLVQASLVEFTTYVLELLFVAEGLAKWSQDPMQQEELPTHGLGNKEGAMMWDPTQKLSFQFLESLSHGCAIQLAFEE
eukprot:6473905-Amphidinium_carterae.1